MLACLPFPTTLVDTIIEKKTLYGLFDEYLYNYHYSNNTKYVITNDIRHFKTYFTHDKNIEDITQDDIQNYVNYEYYACNSKDSTAFSRYSRLRAIFNYAIRKKYIAFNPCDDISITKVQFVRRELDCSKKFIKKILKLFKHTELYEFVYIDLHTRIKKRRNACFR